MSFSVSKVQWLLSVMATILSVIAIGTVTAAPTPSSEESATKFQQRKRACLNQAPLVCQFEPTSGSTVKGLTTIKPAFKFASDRGRQGYHICYAEITATISGLSPLQKHGFHIHTYGDRRLDDGTSTGGHFTDPLDKESAHGFPSSPVRHLGDLGNLISDESGVARFKHFDHVLTLTAVLGRGMTIHAGEDKGPAFPPTGDAGGRVATCVIGFLNPGA